MYKHIEALCRVVCECTSVCSFDGPCLRAGGAGLTVVIVIVRCTRCCGDAICSSRGVRCIPCARCYLMSLTTRCVSDGLLSAILMSTFFNGSNAKRPILQRLYTLLGVPLRSTGNTQTNEVCILVVCARAVSRAASAHLLARICVSLSHFHSSL